MSLLNQIQSKLQQPPATPEPTQDHVIDIDQRDAFISATMAVKDDTGKQAAIWVRMEAEGMNLATLHAATKVLCKYPDSELIRKYGQAQPAELKTAKEWREESGYQTRLPL